MPGFDLDILAAYLRKRLPGLDGPMQATQISGGQSNPTFFLDFPARSLVLRKQPPGNRLPSAHAVDREFRIQSALTGRGVPVPHMLLLEEDPAIIGTKFYVMERLQGRVFHDSGLGGLAADQRADAYTSLAITLARLHRVDWQAAGLTDYGRPGSYFERQISRWTRQWQTTRTRDIPEIDVLAEWLPRNVPGDNRTTIVHGDFRIGNVMLGPATPEIVGVLDWELSTLGHPFADLAHAETTWFIRPEEYGGLLGADLHQNRLPSRQHFEERYLREAGLTEGLQPFHLAFALFRFALIFEGIAARAKGGSAAADNAEQVGQLSVVLGRRAAEVLSSDSAI